VVRLVTFMVRLVTFMIRLVTYNLGDAGLWVWGVATFMVRLVTFVIRLVTFVIRLVTDNIRDAALCFRGHPVQISGMQPLQRNPPATLE